MGNLVASIDGIQLSPLKIIKGEQGSVMHALKQSEHPDFSFGEAYFSTVNAQCIKGWKKHTRMVSNLIVPVGAIRFVFFDDRIGSATKDQFWEITLSPQNYYRLTVQPGLWMAFQGVGQDLNLLLNAASIEHDASECLNDPIETRHIHFEF